MERLASLAGVSLLLSWLGLTWFGPSFVESVGDDAANIEQTNSIIPAEASDKGETNRLSSARGTNKPLEVPLVR
jgi:hypothetical protein